MVYPVGTRNLIISPVTDVSKLFIFPSPVIWKPEGFSNITFVVKGKLPENKESKDAILTPYVSTFHVPMGHVLHPAVGCYSWRPPQSKEMFVPLPQCWRALT